MLAARSLFVASTMLAGLPAQLAGAYTINPTLPTGGSNFASLLDATSALAAQGVVAPVTMLLYDDAGPFTEAAPFATTNGPFAPQTAVLVMTSWTGTSATNRVTFEPAPGETVVFDASNRSMGVFWGGADYVTLRGVEIMNAIHDAISLYAEASHGIALDPIIDGCRLHDCGGTGVTIYGNTPNPTNTLVQNCTFWRLQLTNAGSFNTTGRFGYVTTRRSTGTRIVHNTFMADAGTGSSMCVIGALPSGTAEVQYAEISNNIIVKTAAPSAPMLRFQPAASSTQPLPTVCDSNCFFDTSGGPFANYGTGGTNVAPTLGAWQLAVQRDLASVQGDPQFRSPTNRDYHITALSPCFAASTVAAGVAADVDGQPRTTFVDIGADEFGGSTWSSIGAGCPGTGSLAPQLGTNWPFLGNPAFALTTASAPPGLITVLFGSLGIAPVPMPIGGGCSAYVDVPTAVSLAAALTSPAGSASVVFAVPANPAFVGFHVAYQSLVLDPGAAIGFTTSNALDIVFDF